jgi:flagellar biosynthetic protein FliP
MHRCGYGQRAQRVLRIKIIRVTQPVQIHIDGLGPNATALPVQILVLVTVLALAPSLLIMFTSFTRIIIVLSLLRSALGLPQTPPNQVLIGLALFLTYFVMQPTIDRVRVEAVQPYLDGRIDQTEALHRAEVPMRAFLLAQTSPDDLALFIRAAKLPKPASPNDLPMRVIAPAYIVSEIRTGFIMGFSIYLPFLVIDLVTATVLMSLGMMMLPPPMISLPLKILFFAATGGWEKLILVLIQSITPTQ